MSFFNTKDAEKIDFEPLSFSVIEAAMVVHTFLGPVLFRKLYKACLKHEFLKRNIKLLTEVRLPVAIFGGERARIEFNPQNCNHLIILEFGHHQRSPSHPLAKLDNNWLPILHATSKATNSPRYLAP